MISLTSPSTDPSMGHLLDALPDKGAQVSCISTAALELVKAKPLGRMTYQTYGKDTDKNLKGAGGEPIGTGKVWEGAQILIPISKTWISTDLFVINSLVPKILLSKSLLRELDVPMPEDFLWKRRLGGTNTVFIQQGTKRKRVPTSEEREFKAAQMRLHSEELGLTLSEATH